MKILLISETTHAGVGKHILDLADGMARRGHAVHLVYNPLRMDVLFEERIHSIASENLINTSLRMQRSPHPLDMNVVLRIRSLIQQKGPFDIIHGHSSKGGALARLAAMGKSRPVLYTPHAFFTSNPEIGLVSKVVFGLIEYVFSFLTTRVVAVSRQERDHARTLGISANRLVVIENGIDLAKCNRLPDRREAFGMPRNAVVIGFVGRLTYQKDPENLLMAFEKVAERFPLAWLAFVGEGPLRVELENRARTIGLSSRVCFLGLQNGPDIMTSFDIFALPSRYEGMPYVILEAAASGLPIASTNVAGVVEVVKTGRNGFIVPPENAEAMGRALEWMLESRKLRRRYGEESRTLAAGYSVEAMVEKTEQLYRELSATED